VLQCYSDTVIQCQTAALLPAALLWPLEMGKLTGLLVPPAVPLQEPRAGCLFCTRRRRSASRPSSTQGRVQHFETLRSRGYDAAPSRRRALHGPFPASLAVRRVSFGPCPRSALVFHSSGHSVREPGAYRAPHRQAACGGPYPLASTLHPASSVAPPVGSWTAPCHSLFFVPLPSFRTRFLASSNCPCMLRMCQGLGVRGTARGQEPVGQDAGSHGVQGCQRAASGGSVSAPAQATVQKYETAVQEYSSMRLLYKSRAV